MGFPLTFTRYQDWFRAMWNIHGNQSNLEHIDRLLFIRPLVDLLAAVNVSMLTAAKVLIVGLIIVAGLSAYLLAWVISRKIAPLAPGWAITTIAAAAGTLYELGPSVMYLASAYFYLLSYALAPLLILLIFLSATRARLWWLAGSGGGIVMSIAAASPQHTAFLGLGLTAVVIVLTARYGLRRVVPGVLLFAAGFVATSLYWLIPTVPLALHGDLSPGYLPNWDDTLAFSRNATLYNVLTGYSEWNVWWTPDSWWPDWMIVSLTVARLVLPACALLVIGFAFHSWLVRATTIVAVPAVLAAMGANSPLQPVYRQAMFKIPILNSVGWFIRAPEKFEGYIWLITVCLLTVGAGLLMQRYRSRLLLVALVLVAAVGFGSALPKNLAGFGNKYVAVPVPSEYYAATAALSNAPGSTIWLAPYYDATTGTAGTLAYVWAPDHMASSFMRDSLPGNSYAAYDFTNPFAQEYAYIYSHPDQLSRKLAALDIVNIVLADDLVGGHTGFLRLERVLTGDPGLRLVRRIGADLYLYKRIVSATSPERYMAVQGGRSSQDDIYGPAALDIASTHILYAEQQSDPAWLMANTVGIPWVLDDRSEVDVAMNRFVQRYGISFTNLTDNSNLYGGWGRVQTAMPTDDFSTWHSYLNGLLQTRDAWDFDYGRGVVLTGTAALSLTQTVQVGPGRYELLVRGFENEHSSAIAIRVGKTSRSIDLNIPGNSDLKWMDLGPVSLDRSAATVTITNGQQHGIVNLVALVPEVAYQEAIRNVRDDFDRNGMAVISHDLAYQPANSFLTPDVYRLASGAPVRVVALDSGNAVAAPSSSQTITVTHPGTFAIVPTDATSAFMAANPTDWTISSNPSGLTDAGSGNWQLTRSSSQPQVLQTSAVMIPRGCQTVAVAGQVGIDQANSFSTSIVFLDGAGRESSHVETISKWTGSSADLNIGGESAVPPSVRRIALRLSDIGPAGGRISQPTVRLMCGGWYGKSDTQAILVGSRAQPTPAPFVIHYSSYDPLWAYEPNNGGPYTKSVPVDGALNLFPEPTGEGRTVYLPDAALASGWAATAIGTLILLILTLMVAQIYGRPNGLRLSVLGSRWFWSRPRGRRSPANKI